MPTTQAFPAGKKRNTALVIGAGIAGLTIANTLLAEGWRVLVLERAARPLAAASGQPALAAHVHLSADDNLLSRLTRIALGLMPHTPWPGESRLLHPGRLTLATEHTAQRLTHCLPRHFARAVTATQARELTGQAIDSGGIWLPQLPLLATDLSALFGQHQTLRLRCEVSRLVRDPQEWHAFDQHGTIVARAAIVVLATGGLPAVLSSCQTTSLTPLRGQSTLFESEGPRLQCVIGGHAYACPLPDGRILSGTGISHAENSSHGSPGKVTGEPTALLETQPAMQNARNARGLSRLLNLPVNKLRAVEHWIGWRHAASDRMPLIGLLPDEPAVRAEARRYVRNDRLPLPRQQGLYAAAGFGSRGVLWASLAARLISDHANERPSMLTADLSKVIDPARFLRRALRRNQLE